jgi:hypothetical protein
MEQVGQLGYFEVFPYQESLYGLEHEQQLSEKEKGKRVQELISPLDFRPSGFDRKMKYEDPFAYVSRHGETSPPGYLFPFHIPEYLAPHAGTLTTAFMSQNCAHASSRTRRRSQASSYPLNKTAASAKLEDRRQWRL